MYSKFISLALDKEFITHLTISHITMIRNKPKRSGSLDKFKPSSDCL
jgi:hypothetical protein